MDSTASPKYRWDPPKPDNWSGGNYHPPYYHGNIDVRKAIAEAHGVVYLVIGEPDVLACQAAGIDNAMCWYGETNVPRTLARDLQERGVREAVIYPDLDKTGREFGRIVAERLAGTNITLQAFELPTALGAKGDINKLWIACDFDRLMFLAALAACSPLKIEPPQPKPLPDLPPIGPSGEDSFSPELYQAIEQALGVQRYRGTGFSYNVKCPFHDDKHPSAAWHREKHILHCQTCGQTFLTKDVAEALHIDWHAFVKRPLQPVRREKIAAPPAQPQSIGATVAQVRQQLRTKTNAYLNRPATDNPQAM